MMMIISKLHILILFIVACILILFRYQYSSIIFHHRLLSLINPSIKYNHDAYKMNDHIPYQVGSNNVELKCQYHGYPICCLLLDNPSIGNNTDDRSHQISNVTTHESNHVNKNKNDDQIIININSFSIKPVETTTTTTICSVHKKYISSPYEVRHYEKSVELSSMDDDWSKRRDLLSDFIIDDIPHANKWLRRVHMRMKSLDDDGVIEDTSEDYEYLSRFEVTKTCTATTTSSSSSSSSSTSKSTAAAIMNSDDHDPRSIVKEMLPSSLSSLQSFVSHQQAQSTSHLHSTEPISSSSSSSSSSSTTMTWNEWIEPLSIHARHPFSYIECRKETFYKPIKYFIDYIYQSASKMEFKSKLTGVDYILLQSEASLQNHTKYMYRSDDNRPFSTTSPQWSKYDDSSTTHGFTYSNSNKHSSRREAQQQHHHHPVRRNYMFDADCATKQYTILPRIGTSTFESSLRWFLCGYLQRRISFDQIYGWEYSHLKPIPFWKSVPDSIIAIYHFFNVPITAGQYDKHSPIRLIKKIAKEYDFVSFKLDIDTPAVEIPIALELMKDDELIHLVDEFFFELHFHCEFMEHCGWGSFEMPSMFPPDKKLDRQYTLKLFHTMRKSGIRAHIWP